MYTYRVTAITTATQEKWVEVWGNECPAEQRRSEAEAFAAHMASIMSCGRPAFDQVRLERAFEAGKFRKLPVRSKS